MVSQRDERERHLWFDATPVQLIHERWTTEFSVFWAARPPGLMFSAEGGEVLSLKPALTSAVKPSLKPFL